MIATNIRVSLGRRDVLHGINLKARAGEVTAIVGPNGSGKSTLLRTLTGEIPYTGSVALNGRPIGDFAPWDLAACRGVLQQSLSVAFPFTVGEVVQMGHTAGLEAADPNIPWRALAQVDLGDFAHRLYHELSGGEQQRAQLARVLAQVWPGRAVSGPKWLLLDEPVSSLDIGHQLLIVDLITRFAGQGGGVIAVMHDLNLTAMCADQVILMKSGQVLASGTVADTLTCENLTAAYDCPVRVNVPAPPGMPFILPQARMM